MKKFRGIFVAVLALALLLGAVVGISATAAEDATAPAANEKWVISANVAYADDIHPYFAIDADLVEDVALLSVTVDGKATEISTEKTEIKDGVFAYVVEAAGVVAKNMGKTLPIVVKYNGEVVEETSYSVAEYFYERLYKNGFAKKFDGEDCLRKELYISTLEYGAAAQKLLAPGTKLVTEFVYVVDGNNAGFWDSSKNYVTEDKVIKVTSYPTLDNDGVISYVSAGMYKINASAIIEVLEIEKYQTSDKAYGFDNLEATDNYVFNASDFTDVTVNHYNGGNPASSVTMTQKIVSEEENTYFSATKTASPSSNGQTWLNMKRTDSSNVGNVLMFEAKFRIDYLQNSSTYLRFYKNGTNTKGNDGTVLGSGGGRNISFNVQKGKIVVGDFAVDAVENEWFTLRLVLRNVDVGMEVDVYSENDEGYLVHRGTVSKPEWTQVSAGEITNVVFMNDSTTLLNFDVDDVYIGAPIDENMQYPVLSNGSADLGYELVNAIEFGQAKYKDENGAEQYAFDEAGNPIPMFKGSFEVIRDIMTGAPVGEYFLNDPMKGGGNSGQMGWDKVHLDLGQAIFHYYPDGKSSDGDNTFVFESTYRITGSDGQNHFDITLRNSNGKRVYRTYFGNGKIGINTGESYVSGGYKDNEWFTIRVEYTVVGATKDEARFFVQVFVNDVLKSTSELATKESYYAAGADVVRASLLLSKDFVGTLEVKDISMSWTTKEFPAAE